MQSKKVKISAQFFFLCLHGLEFSNIRTYFNKEKDVLEIKANYTSTELIIKDCAYTAFSDEQTRTEFLNHYGINHE